MNTKTRAAVGRLLEIVDRYGVAGDDVGAVREVRAFLAEEEGDRREDGVDRRLAAEASEAVATDGSPTDEQRAAVKRCWGPVYGVTASGGASGAWRSVVTMDGVKVFECSRGHASWSDAVACGNATVRRIRGAVEQCVTLPDVASPSETATLREIREAHGGAPRGAEGDEDGPSEADVRALVDAARVVDEAVRAAVWWVRHADNGDVTLCGSEWTRLYTSRDALSDALVPWRRDHDAVRDERVAPSAPTEEPTTPATPSPSSPPPFSSSRDAIVDTLVNRVGVLELKAIHAKECVNQLRREVDDTDEAVSRPLVRLAGLDAAVEALARRVGVLELEATHAKERDDTDAMVSRILARLVALDGIASGRRDRLSRLVEARRREREDMDRDDFDPEAAGEVATKPSCVGRFVSPDPPFTAEVIVGADRYVVEVNEYGNILSTYFKVHSGERFDEGGEALEAILEAILRGETVTFSPSDGSTRADDESEEDDDDTEDLGDDSRVRFAGAQPGETWKLPLKLNKKPGPGCFYYHVVDADGRILTAVDSLVGVTSANAERLVEAANRGLAATVPDLHGSSADEVKP